MNRVSRARLPPRLVATLLALATGVSLLAAAADARVATTGAGRYLDTVDWIEWSKPFELLSGAGTQTRSSATTVAGSKLVVSCSLSNFDGIAMAYLPGTWIGDALDDLYGVGGRGALNELVDGLAARVDAHPTATLDFACSAAIGGRPLALDGVVFADAGQSVRPEHIQATVASGTTWHVIDRLRSPGCASSTEATRTDDGVTNTLRLAGTDRCPTGPAVVAYVHGASSGQIDMHALTFGRAATALGVLIPIDRSDAPLAYGEAAHLMQPTLQGGEPPRSADAVAVSDPGFELAAPQPPPTRLGDSVDPGGSASDDALGDDAAGTGGTFGPADDETDDPPKSIAVRPGEPFVQRDVACTGPGFVAGWIDFDASGSFGRDERSDTALCSGRAVDLTWTVPPDVRARSTTFQRLRIAAVPADVATPVGLAASGEVEDHTLTTELVEPAPDEPDAVETTPATAPASGALGPLAATIASLTARVAPAATAPPDPQLGESVAVAESTGEVRVKVPGSTRYVELAQATDVPLGSRVDARKGKVTLTAEVDATTGATQTATFFSGIFVVTQTPGPKPLIRLKLVGGSFAGCSGRVPAARTILGARAAAIPFQFAARKRSKRKVRRLWGKGKGAFQTSGLRSSATVRGTYWLVEDRCDGTYTQVKRGFVDVRDFRLRKTIRLRAGRRSRYLARAT